MHALALVTSLLLAQCSDGGTVPANLLCDYVIRKGDTPSGQPIYNELNIVQTKPMNWQTKPIDAKMYGTYGHAIRLHQDDRFRLFAYNNEFPLRGQQGIPLRTTGVKDWLFNCKNFNGQGYWVFRHNQEWFCITVRIHE